METKEYLYYGFGRIALALALADGKVNTSEIKMLEQSINEIAEEEGIDLSLVTASFRQWSNSGYFSSAEMMRGGVRDFHLGDLHLTPKLARIFREITIDLVNAEAPVTNSEHEMAHEFISYLHEREKAAL